MNGSDHTFLFSDPTPIRLDKYLVSQLPTYSRTRIQDLIRIGFVQVQGLAVVKTGAMLENGSVVQIHIPPAEPSELIPEQIPLDVIFEDQNLLVINKPAGMVVHPAVGHMHGTLTHAALAYAPEIEGVGGVQRPGIVHRLDKDTSGLILVAKNDSSHRWLQDQFRLRKVDKTYLALVDGVPPTPSGRIEAPIGRDPSHRKRMAVVSASRGRVAVTEYLTLQRYEKHTLLEAHPHTGRTHQIRLHLAFLHCPVVGDVVYGHKKSTIDIHRHFLHAFRISLTLLGDKTIRSFEAPLPKDLQEILDHLE